MGLVLGGVSTADLLPEEIIELQASYPFTQSEIRRLYRRFRKLDVNKTGGITRAQLLKIPELSMNPLAQRIISLFHPPPPSLAALTASSAATAKPPATRHDTINFRDFLQMLSNFSDRATVLEKEKLAFRVYDINNDGYISANELFEVMKTMVGDNVKNDALKEMVQRTIANGDKDGDGQLNFEEFRHIMHTEETETALNMTIQFSAEDLREDGT